jgi:hypothetical protein
MLIAGPLALASSYFQCYKIPTIFCVTVNRESTLVWMKSPSGVALQTHLSALFTLSKFSIFFHSILKNRIHGFLEELWPALMRLSM